MNKLFKMGGVPARLGAAALAAVLAANFVACSDSSSAADDGVAGSTSEPNAVQATALTEEQIAVLNKGLGSLVDTVVIVTEPSSVGGEGVKDTSLSFIADLETGFRGEPSDSYKYISDDSRRRCNVEDYPSVPGLWSVRQKVEGGVLNEAGRYVEQKSFYSYTKVVTTEVDSMTIVLRTSSSGLVGHGGYWGKDYSCEEYLEVFKSRCEKDNGVFTDFGEYRITDEVKVASDEVAGGALVAASRVDASRSLRKESAETSACSNGKLVVACAFFVPEGKTAATFMQDYKDTLIASCKADSAYYAPADDFRNEPMGCTSRSGYNMDYKMGYYDTDCLRENVEDEYKDSENDQLFEVWSTSLERTFTAYRDQFGLEGSISEGVAYRNLDPESWQDEDYVVDFAASVKTDDLLEDLGYEVTNIFRESANSPYLLRSTLNGNVRDAFYILRLRDEGARGHMIKSVSEDEIVVLDILKKGDCPEDSKVYYPVFMLKNHSWWDVSKVKITRETVESPLWDCGNPENFAKIEPYGEWTEPSRLNKN